LRRDGRHPDAFALFVGAAGRRRQHCRQPDARVLGVVASRSGTDGHAGRWRRSLLRRRVAVAMATRRTPLVGGGGDAGAAASMSMADITTAAAAAAKAVAADEVAPR